MMMEKIIKLYEMGFKLEWILKTIGGNEND